MTLGIFANLRKPGIAEIVLPLLDWLGKRGITVIVREDLFRSLSLSEDRAVPVSDERFGEECDVAVALGGDGTMLTLARLIGRKEKPIIGVNLGGLGFLAEVAVDDLYPKMEKVISGSYGIEKRMVLEASLTGTVRTGSVFAMNDVVLDRGASSRVLRIRVHVDGVYFNTYTSDGIIVSTPTGSTAYSLAASGPILVPSMESIILNPICPHTLTARPTVIPASGVVELVVEFAESEAVLSVDGQTVAKPASGCKVLVQKGDYSVHLIVLEDHHFFELLREKLQWGSLPRK
jgi:NAD+ kinase